VAGLRKSETCDVQVGHLCHREDNCCGRELRAQEWGHLCYREDNSWHKAGDWASGEPIPTVGTESDTDFKA